MQENKIPIRIKKNYFFTFLCLVFVFFPNNRALAWDALPAELAGISMTQALKAAQDTVLASLKLEAVRFIQEEVNNNMGAILGGTTSVMGVYQGYIEDWEAFLVQEPGNQVASRLEEVLFKATGGRSSSNYRSRIGNSTPRYSSVGEGFDDRGLYSYAQIEDHGQMYRQELRKLDALIMEERSADWDPNYRKQPEIEINPRAIFNGKRDLRNLDIYFSGINNPWTYQDYQNRKLISEYERKQRELEIRAMLGKGFFSSDYTTKQAVEAAAMMEAAKTAQIALITNSDSAVEAAALVAVAKVTDVLTNSIRNVRRSYNADMNAYRNKLLSKFDGVFEGGYPEDVFGEQIEERKARQNQFSTGAQYDRIGTR